MAFVESVPVARGVGAETGEQVADGGGVGSDALGGEPGPAVWG